MNYKSSRRPSKPRPGKSGYIWVQPARNYVNNETSNTATDSTTKSSFHSHDNQPTEKKKQIPNPLTKTANKKAVNTNNVSMYGRLLVTVLFTPLFNILLLSAVVYICVAFRNGRIVMQIKEPGNMVSWTVIEPTPSMLSVYDYVASI